LSPEERAARGFTLLDIEAVEDRLGLGGRILLDLERFDRAPLEGRIGIGDLVELRPRRAEVQEPARGVVARRTRLRLTVAFDHAPPPFVYEGRLLADLVPNDVTFERARNALSRVSRAERGPERRRRELLLGREEARLGAPRPLSPGRPLNP